MKLEQLELMFPLMVIAMLVWGYQDESEPKQTKDELLLADNHQIFDDPNPIPITPQQKEWAEKAVRKYAEAQEKKWRNWTEAMFDLKE